jgi:hypothetical protein
VSCGCGRREQKLVCDRRGLVGQKLRKWAVTIDAECALEKADGFLIARAAIHKTGQCVTEMPSSHAPFAVLVAKQTDFRENVASSRACCGVMRVFQHFSQFTSAVRSLCSERRFGRHCG